MFKNVVFPVPVPPDIKMETLPSTHFCRKSSIFCDKEWSSIYFCAVIISLLNLRMVSVDPFGETGGIVALTREPSSSLASTIGVLKSTSRPTGCKIRLITLRRDSSSANDAFTAYTIPPFSTQILSYLCTTISVISLLSRYCCNGPSPMMFVIANFSRRFFFSYGIGSASTSFLIVSSILAFRASLSTVLSVSSFRY